MTKRPEKEFILLRGPGIFAKDGNMNVQVSMLKASTANLTGYSFLRSTDVYEEWVPTEELHLYQSKMLFNI